MNKGLSRSILLMSICLTGVMILGLFGFNKNAVAKVGGDVVTLEEYNARIANFPPQLKAALEQEGAKERVLDQMIDELVLYQSAEDKNYHNSKEYKSQLANLKKQLLLNLLIRDEIDNKISVTDSDIVNFYNENKAKFSASEQRRASHILVKTNKEAKSTLAKLKAGGDFAKLAASLSEDPGSKTRGGDLGWFQKGQLVPAFEKAVFTMKRKGQLSSVVKTQFGYHVIRLDDIKVRPEVSLQQAAQQIKQSLVAQQKRDLTSQLLESLKKNVKIEKSLAKLEPSAPKK